MIDVVIPHWSAVPGADDALERCLRSLDEENVLTFIIRNNGTGYAKTVNQGLAKTKSDYILVMNNDCWRIYGDLGLLCNMYGVTVPMIDPAPRDTNPRAVFCLPRWVYDEIGGFDERFEGGYFEDDDYIRRLNNAKIPIYYEPNVVFGHLNGGGLSMKYLGEQENFDKNQRVFSEKWDSL